jgi:K+-sensing histidine kinase KdpD
MDTSWMQRLRPLALVIAAGLPLLWCALAAQVRGHVTAATAALVLVLLVVAAASTGDRLTGAVAAVSGGVWFDYFLAPPFHHLSIEDSNDVEVTALLVVVGLAVTELALWGRRQQATSSTRAGYLQGVLTTSQVVAGESSSTKLADQVAGLITDLLDVDACRFVAASSLPPNSAVLGPDGEVTARGTRVDVKVDGLPSLEEIVLPAQHHGEVHGFFLITAATEVTRPPLEQRQVAVLLANQVGAAYATDRLGPRS